MKAISLYSFTLPGTDGPANYQIILKSLFITEDQISADYEICLAGPARFCVKKGTAIVKSDSPEYAYFSKMIQAVEITFDNVMPVMLQKLA